MQQKLISACHDLSDGGLGVALAEMSLAGRLGARVNLERVPASGVTDTTELLYTESASRLLVTVPRNAIPAFQALWAKELGVTAALIGNVTDTPDFVVAQGEQELIRLDVETLAHAFKATLDW